MIVLVSLATAALFGAGDFLGGIATKRRPVLSVVAGAHLIGLVGVGAVAPWLADVPSGRDLGLGALGGLWGMAGLALLYRRLAEGPMQVVAPITAIMAAAVPTGWSVVRGDQVSAVVWVGITIALVAIALVSRPGGASQTGSVTVKVVTESLASGVGFGAFFIFLDATSAGSAPWPVVAARMVTSGVLVALLVVTGVSIWPPTGSDRLLVLGAGGLDALANVGFLYATLNGTLAVVAVLTSLYPVATVILARSVLGERTSRWQQVGLVLAIIATTTMAAA